MRQLCKATRTNCVHSALEGLVSAIEDIGVIVASRGENAAVALHAINSYGVFRERRGLCIISERLDLADRDVCIRAVEDELGIRRQGSDMHFGAVHQGGSCFFQCNALFFIVLGFAFGDHIFREDLSCFLLVVFGAADRKQDGWAHEIGVFLAECIDESIEEKVGSGVAEELCRKLAGLRVAAFELCTENIGVQLDIMQDDRGRLLCTGEVAERT